MSLTQFLKESRDLQKNKSTATAARIAAENVLRGCAVRTYMLWEAFGEFDTVLNGDWDLFIVLDSCRYDLMEDVQDDYDFLETLRPHQSYATSSQDWIQKTFMKDDLSALDRAKVSAKLFRDPYQNDVIGDYFTMRDVSDVAYITGNPQCTMLDGDAFHEYTEIWKTDWKDIGEGYIHPRGITEEAIRTMRESNPNQTVLHYMQPHGGFRLADNPGFPWEKLQRGDRDLETTWEYYEDNLHWVLEEVELLLENVDAEKVVISADHGNSVGGCGFYGHRPYLPLSGMRTVPWVETSATDEETFEPSGPAELEETNRDELLEALGYK